jgi:hypothetical protein
MVLSLYLLIAQLRHGHGAYAYHLRGGVILLLHLYQEVEVEAVVAEVAPEHLAKEIPFNSPSRRLRNRFVRPLGDFPPFCLLCASPHMHILTHQSHDFLCLRVMARPGW